MPDPYRFIYLDATSWITVLSGAGPDLDDLRLWLGAVDAGQVRVAVSALMPLEILGGNRNERTAESAAAALRALERRVVRQIAASPAVVDVARDLRLRHRIASMDALHLASASIGQAEAFLTNDEKLLALGRAREVTIVRPYWTGDLPLDFDG